MQIVRLSCHTSLRSMHPALLIHSMDTIDESCFVSALDIT